MEIWEILISVFGSVMASSGLWALIMKRQEKKDIKSRMLLGLAHDRIMDLGQKYIEGGSITYDEYENLEKYLYEPYVEMGGNGSAKRVMDEVNKLKLTNNENTAESWKLSNYDL